MCQGDVAVVTAVASGGATATVRVGDSERTVALLEPDTAVVGDHVLLHAGFAVEVLSEEDATWLSQDQTP
jgi:hydrogenase expression/formation protein HypC